MAQFMFLIRGGDYENATPDQMGSVVEKFIQWSRSIRDAGHSITGDELDDRSVLLSKEGDKVITTDGVFTESKDLVGGYFLLEAPDLDTAVAIARGCPNLAYGGCVEVREVIVR